MPGVMPGETEPIRTEEQVLHFVRKEGDMPRPEDIRCEATIRVGEDGEVEISRCENNKTVNPETGGWLRWCAEHQAIEVAARNEGGERVQRFVGAE